MKKLRTSEKVSEWRLRYDEDLKLNRFRPQTVKKYRYVLLRFFAFTWEKPDQITDEDIRNYLSLEYRVRELTHVGVIICGDENIVVISC